MDDLASLPPGLMSTSARVMEVGDVLAASGYTEAAERVNRRSLAMLEARGTPEEPATLLEWAQVLRRIGRLDEAAGYAERSHRTAPGNRLAHALAGLTGAQKGDRDRAEQVADELAAREDLFSLLDWMNLRCHQNARRLG